ncbi:ERO1-like protein alpha [Nematocida sp. LUAm3]|nr:ERO1-like protein alpha [Nematocida sp. LUAm3]KAI5174594.1 ERO1-like protein alpha [Nematocida sp. LUAm2]KAI5178000.1 ERO1-like protein alpha [Nematocida sp. LUAm1]
MEIWRKIGIIGIFVGCSYGAMHYSNVEIRGQISALCSMDCFSKTTIEISHKCPEYAIREIKACGVACELDADAGKPESSLDRFHTDAGEQVILESRKEEETKYLHLDLKKIIERYTGYPEGKAVWQVMHSMVKNDPLLSCMLSGIHCSITIHKFSFYNDDPTSKSLYMHYNMIMKKVENAHLDNMKKMMDLSLSLIPDVIEEIENIGRPFGDCNSVILNLKEILPQNMTLFNEYSIGPDTLDRVEMLCSMIGCVQCMRCKVWGKVQMEGLKCLVKILLKKKGENPEISQREVIYFINLINKLSTSAVQFQRFLTEKEKKLREISEKKERICNIVDGIYSLAAAPLLRTPKETCKRRMCAHGAR